MRTCRIEKCVDQRSSTDKFPSSHSIIGLFAPPTTVTPRLLSASGSVALTIVASGSMGLSAFTLAASRADCSIASISALHPA